MAHLKQQMTIRLLIIVLASLLHGCSDCSKFANEEYLQEDSLTWNSPEVSNVGYALQDLHLKRLDDAEQPAYRMLYHHAFIKHDRFIELCKTDSGYYLSEIEFQSEYKDDKYRAALIKSKLLKLSEFEWNEFERKIYDAHFWTLPKPINERGLDGRTIILEGCRPDARKCNKRSYQMIARWSPEPGPLRDAIDLLLAYSGHLNES